MELVTFSVGNSLADKELKIANLMQATNFNRIYAEKCLVENDWDLDRSLQNLKVLSQYNQIPKEAFIH